jgi:predicted DNA-binding antitoxin AbrB/MazE fold protein
MPSFDGIYENGVVRFAGPVDIPEGAKVTVVVIDVSPTQPPLGSNSPELYEILSRSYDTGETDLAARHNEHQP